MSFKKIFSSSLLFAALAAGLLASNVGFAQTATRVFELRTYTTNDGKFNDLLNRFRDHTVRLFAKHDMVSIGYWIPKTNPTR
jgi:hypothetical protein